MNDTTIAAISTAYGEAGIGVIRISGDESKKIAEQIFVPAKGKEGFSFKPRYMHFGHIEDPKTGKIIDEALVVYMKAPHTYTGEDVVEIQCHGNYISLREILQLVLSLGAEPADRGEFTKRAFLSGRMDLSQAEAVMDMISSRTEKSHELAAAQLSGSVSSRMKSIAAKLLDELVQIGVNMDYPDEDIEAVTYEKLKNNISSINDELLNLYNNSREGRMIREGISAAIIGRPNVGKSSLLNLFLEEERSIVTDIPGTTRDTVEEQASVRGIPVSFIDTAGIRESSDEVERLGIERSRKAIDKADFLLLILDRSEAFTGDDIELLKNADKKNCIVVLNKGDKPASVTKDDVAEYFDGTVLEASFKQGTGIEELKTAIENIVYGEGFKRTEDPVLSNERHIDLVRRAHEELEQAIGEIDAQNALDFIEINVRSAYQLIGEITGDTAAADLIDEIFKRFCLGK